MSPRPHSSPTSCCGAPWLTCVHGATQDRRVFSGQVEAFRDRFRVLRVDLAGHGSRGHVPGPYGPEEYLADVLGTLDEAGVRETIWWGTHTGAAVGLLLALRAPARVRALVLEGAVVPGAPIASVSAALARARATTRRAGLQAAAREWFRTAPWFRVIRERPLECRAREHLEMVLEFPGGPWRDDAPGRDVTVTDADLAEIRVPVLLVNGEREVRDFVPVAQRLHALLPSASRVVIPHAGGFPLWEFPGAVNRAVSEFVDSAFARPAAPARDDEQISRNR